MLSISMPVSRASSMWSSAESTSTARWLSSGRSGSPGSPGWNSTYAPPTSTRGAPEGPGSAGAKPSRSYSSAVCSGRVENSAAWSRAYSGKIASTGHSGSQAPQSMHSSGSMTRMRSASWMQSTGQTSTHERSLMSMQGSAIMYVTAALSVLAQADQLVSSSTSSFA